MVIEREEEDAWLNVVQAYGIMVEHVALVIHVGFDPTPYVLQIGFVFVDQVGLVHSGQEDALMVVEMANRRQVGRVRIGAAECVDRCLGILQGC